MKKEFIQTYNSLAEIEDLIQAFETCKLPRSTWTHEAHLTVGLWYLLKYPEEQAIQFIRNGIQAYNLACGITQTPKSGYHETITLFWVWAIQQYLKNADLTQNRVDLANGLLQSPYADKSFPLNYYSKERLLSWEARTGWIAPDLMPMG